MKRDPSHIYSDRIRDMKATSLRELREGKKHRRTREWRTRRRPMVWAAFGVERWLIDLLQSRRIRIANQVIADAFMERVAAASEAAKGSL